MADPDVHSAYRQAGVDYAVLDAGKRDALGEALATSHWLAAAGGRALDASRGEPAFVLRFAGSTLAFVLETLGTKSMLAREYEEAAAAGQAGDAPAGGGHFADIAYDTVAAVLNDLICVGALPLVLNAYFATGSSAWYTNGARAGALLEGWRRACDDAQCAWGGGESPALAGLLGGEDIELAGSALGFVPPPGEPLLGGELAPGDEIVLVPSNGLHANGASLARRIAGQLPRGLLTPLSPDLAGESFGAALLRPSFLYVELVRRLLGDPEVELTYLSHITGHGLLKLMRPRRELTYRIHALPPVPPVLRFLAEHAGLDPAAAYSTLNMGAGFAVYCRAGHGVHVVRLARELGLDALLAGAVEEGPRQVVLEPVAVTFASDQLALAPEPQAQAGERTL
ncbi:MAG TPA: AIR synthase related protein [Solirubrobacteraceae bacterium]